MCWQFDRQLYISFSFSNCFSLSFSNSFVDFFHSLSLYLSVFLSLSHYLSTSLSLHVTVFWSVTPFLILFILSLYLYSFLLYFSFSIPNYLRLAHSFFLCEQDSVSFLSASSISLSVLPPSLISSLYPSLSPTLFITHFEKGISILIQFLIVSY